MTDSRKVLTSVIASVVVIGVVVGLVLVFAIIPLPTFASLVDEPDTSIPGTVAFSQWDNGDLCIWTVDAAGGEEPHEVLCDGNIGFADFLPGWTAEGMLLVQDFRGESQAFRVIDPETGTTLNRVTMDQTDTPRDPVGRDLYTAPDGSEVYTENDPGSPRVVVQSPTGVDRTILEVEGPKDYSFNQATWSPDGEWLLVQDSEGRLLILAAQGDPNPRILVDDSDGWSPASWFIPGYTEGTWDPNE
jgi:Tol biopolymer transport system component